MSATKIHVMLPNNGGSACGIPSGSVYRNAIFRSVVTCKKCKKHPHYKTLLIHRK